MHHLTREQARRIAVRAQLLDRRTPPDIVGLVEHLTLLQLDPTAAIAPSADLVPWSRLGSGYSTAALQTALEQDRTLFEFNALVRPMSQLGLYLDEMALWHGRARTHQWMRENDRFRRDILERLEAEGPMLSRDIPDTSQVPWASTGWTHDRNVTQMLEFLMMGGEVAVSARQGRQRLWDVVHRVYPPNLEAVPLEEAIDIRNRLRLRSLGLARARTTKAPVELWHVGDTGEPAVVEGTKGEWRVDPTTLSELDAEFVGRTALLSPFDRLVHDRARAQELFDFEYVLEMYKPVTQRRWGYYALPILHGDRLVGKLDARADRKAGTLQVHAIHEDVAFSDEVRSGVIDEIESLAMWLGLQPTGI